MHTELPGLFLQLPAVLPIIIYGHLVNFQSFAVTNTCSSFCLLEKFLGMKLVKSLYAGNFDMYSQASLHRGESVYTSTINK